MQHALWAIQASPPLWARRNCCSINVARIIREKGGRAIYGYKIWANDAYAEAEAHCIWEDTTGQLSDITFNQDGETKIFFVPVPAMNQTKIQHGEEKPRYALDPDMIELVEIEKEANKVMKYVWMSEEESWDKQLTYEQWLSGKR